MNEIKTNKNIRFDYSCERAFTFPLNKPVQEVTRHLRCSTV